MGSSTSPITDTANRRQDPTPLAVAPMTTPKRTDKIFDIADIPFSGVSDEEKQHIDNGVYDQPEHYNRALRPFLPEIKEFGRFNHLNVLHPILRLIALSLELPEDALVNIHNYDAIGATYGTLDPIVAQAILLGSLTYHALSGLLHSSYPRSAEEEAKTNNIWFQGHTDFGSITILWSQPVAALQILSKDGRWRWVKHIDNALVVNAGDALDFLTGGYYQGTVHRVVQPPPDQQQYTRLGVFYFVGPDDHTKLIPMRESPLLQRVGIDLHCEDSVAPTMEQWRKGRTSAYDQSDLKGGKGKGFEEEVKNGVVVKHWK
ncbi:hypothetical protein HD554DRAFT_2299316 [Boletus coccyginus]|nr:hypothetical protein HD554DRAFT_2299316 [Boletus coccyginus]